MGRLVPWIVIGGLVVVGAIVGWPFISRQLTIARTRSRCQELEQQLILLRTQGGNVAQAAQLEAMLIQCTADLEAMGEDVDSLSVTITRCTAAQEQINQEWAHYRSTEYSDLVKRNNTRSAILRIGEEMARCYREAIDAAEQPDQLRRIRETLSEAISESAARINCYRSDSPGCGRFGLNEDHGNDKARAERERVYMPLVHARAELDARLRAATATPGQKENDESDGIARVSRDPDAAPVEAATAQTIGGRK